ncbi:MAG TPA: 2-amino-4-hydroxy-6-hydroxymethyldihydropteridine diphosphokinase [Phycicoccus sp.]|nr:2-amino-4-hydroxy-6-hydroxymethyldihydropteridine diphosphokinase [Phycicoccus sp.]
MADVIRLTGVSGTGHHGVFDHEKRDGQTFVVDVALELALASAGRSDDLARTVNYGEIGAQVLGRIEGEPFDLIERLAEVIAEDVLAVHRLVDEVTVTVHKPQAPVGVPFGDVTVSVTRRRAPVPVVIALGANLGDAEATLFAAVAALDGLAGLSDLSVSATFETEPVGGPDQPAYLNCVVTGRTRWSAPRLLGALHEIEADHGRVREVHWGARTLDLDLIQWGEPGGVTEWRSDLDDLTLPHPRAYERGFVLAPWLDVDPEARLRVGDEVVAVAELVGRVDLTGVRARPDDTGGCCQ